MSLVNTTVWGTVSLSTVKQTPVWQRYADKHGRVSHDIYNEVLKASLIYLGMDEAKGRHTTERDVNIRSNENNRIVYAKATLFTFAVKSNSPFKRAYESVDILHVGPEDFTCWGDSHIKLEDFGNAYDPARADDNINQ